MNCLLGIFCPKGAAVCGIGALQSPTDVLYLAGVLLILVLFVAVFAISMGIWMKRTEVMVGKDAPEAKRTLTPTQKFILAASSPTIGNNYKCVIDIWETRQSEAGREYAKKLFEWGWGEFTRENARAMAQDCLNTGYNIKYREYCSADRSSPEVLSRYSDFQRALLEEMKRQYPKQGMLAWDLVRALSVVGGAYMGGIMEYEEAVQIAFEACRLLQNNFSSWDDMVGSYTLGYQFWRGEKKTDRLKYYRKLKKTWIFKIPWSTALRESELGISIW